MCVIPGTSVELWECTNVYYSWNPIVEPYQGGPRLIPYCRSIVYLGEREEDFEEKTKIPVTFVLAWQNNSLWLLHGSPAAWVIKENKNVKIKCLHFGNDWCLCWPSVCAPVLIFHSPIECAILWKIHSLTLPRFFFQLKSYLHQIDSFYVAISDTLPSRTVELDQIKCKLKTKK